MTTYVLDIENVLSTSQIAWDRVGPDFADRMTALRASEVLSPTVIEFPKAERSEWSQARALLKQEDSARYDAWFKPLSREGIEGETLILRAPSVFHADYVTTHLIGDVIRAVAQVKRSLTSVRLIVP